MFSQRALSDADFPLGMYTLTVPSDRTVWKGVVSWLWCRLVAEVLTNAMRTALPIALQRRSKGCCRIQRVTWGEAEVAMRGAQGHNRVVTTLMVWVLAPMSFR